MTQSVCIAVCTAKRPGMLANCLQSLVEQEVPEDWSVSAVVVENDPQPQCRDKVLAVAQQAPWPIHYAVEPEVGIPMARNRAVEVALQQSADWILFVDDDERADPGWLKALCHAARTLEADVLMGPVRSVYPEDTPDWLQHRRKSPPPTGSLLQRVYSGNTMMNISLVDAGGLNLRFDESLRYTGGEDTEFFHRALQQGKIARSVQEAGVCEDVPPGRLTLKWHLQRTVRTRANSAQLKSQQKGLLLALPLYTARTLGKLVAFPLYGCAALLIRPFNRIRSNKLVVFSLEQLVTIQGYWQGVLNRLPEPYRHVDGY